tara:strand:- start:9874 stop:10665 length:792 start_codon:yes stop_codon:yes gene_type:complete
MIMMNTNLYFLILFTLGHAFGPPKKKLAVFGSTGKTGQCVVKQALERKMDVVSLVRPNYDLESTDSHTIYKGDATSMDDVLKIYQENDVWGTIIALGGNTKEVGKTMLTDSTNNIIKSILNTQSSHRIAAITSIGVGDSADKPPFFFKILMKTILKDGIIDKNNQEELFNKYSDSADLMTTIVRPSGLVGDVDDDSAVAKTIILSEDKYENDKLVYHNSDFDLYPSIGSIHRSNVAEYLLDSVCISPVFAGYNKKIVSITSEV